MNSIAVSTYIKRLNSLNDQHVTVFYRQFAKNVASPILVGLMALLLSTNAFADCGGYVNIGNKSKLRELQKEGFAFGSTMKSHPPQLHGSKADGSDLQDSFVPHSRPNLNDSDGWGRVRKEQSSRPVPCTGSTCGSNPLPKTAPVSIIAECLPSKPLKPSAASHEKISADSYFGYFEYSETPFLFKLLIDRPPE